MKRFSQRGGIYNPVADINIVPLMDLVFNLLIVFMLATPLLEQSVDINLPTNHGKSVESKEITTVNLDSTGRIFVDEKLVDLKTLQHLISTRVLKNKDHAVMVRGDKKVDYGRFVEIVDHIKLAGATKLGIMGMSPTK